MATADILPAFSYKWAQDGNVDAITDAQYKAGWSFIGATPPTVEQFNKVQQLNDDKTNYLYAQMKAIFDAAGETPSAADLTSLRDALRSAGVFTTPAPGTNNTMAATTAFVQAAIAAAGRGLLNMRIFGVSGVYTYTPTPGTKSVLVQLVGGGGGGSPCLPTSGSEISAGPGGGGGGFCMSYLTTGFAGVTIAIGVGGPSGFTGGTSSFGAIMSAGGGTCSGSAAGQPMSDTRASGQGIGGYSSGGNLVNSQGGSGWYGFTSPGGPVSGGGGESFFARGAPYVSATSAGINGAGPGAGGSGASTLQGNSTVTAGGQGVQGMCLIWEFGG